jgi:hypothetical protein
MLVLLPHYFCSWQAAEIRVYLSVAGIAWVKMGEQKQRRGEGFCVCGRHC